MRLKLFNGLWGVASDGTLSTPSGRRFVRLPTPLAFRIHSFLNSFAWLGMIGTHKAFWVRG